MIHLEDITDEILSYDKKADIELVWKAYVFSAKVHKGQVRVSGEPYLTHPLEVSLILAKLKMDVVSVVVGLLHDTLEDTFTTEEELEELFGKEVLLLVDGLTKISRIKFSSKEEQQAQNYRKIILAMSKDIRVIIVKLADRLHNMKTLQYMPVEKQQKISKETIDIYAPIANRLGIGWVKQQLEDISFQYLYPDEFEKITNSLTLGSEERMSYIDEVKEVINSELLKSNIKSVVEGRTKHSYSIFRKMKRQDIPFDQIYDLRGIRVVTETIKDCYSILGSIHTLWKPIPGKIKDYIAMPKANMYQSLHTTVVGPGGKLVEFQIRTKEMHKVAKEGVAAHWKYKEVKKKGEHFTVEKPEQKFAWLRQMLEWQNDMNDPKEYLDTMRIDLYPDEVYVFTPEGDVKELPHGATPLDFAYSIHTDIGHQCVGAKVNGKIVSLKYQLENGDFVEIMTSSTQNPKRDWLKVVKSSRARSKISSFLKEEQKERSIQLGKELLEQEIKKYDVGPDKYFKSIKLEPAARQAGFSSADNLLASIGFGKYPVRQIISKILPAEKIKEHRDKEKWSIRNIVNKVITKKASDDPVVKVRGIEDILIRFAKCCTVVPGDRIVGYITRGRGVTIHNSDCPNISDLKYDPNRRIEVEWDMQKKSLHRVKILVSSINKPGILGNISNTIASKSVNINEAIIHTHEDGSGASLEFTIEIEDFNQLQGVLNSIKKLKGITDAARLKNLRAYKKVGNKK